MTDDGPGIPETATPGLGHRLIETLSRQIEADARWDRSGNGTTLTLEFPIRVT